MIRDFLRAFVVVMVILLVYAQAQLSDDAAQAAQQAHLNAAPR